MHGGRWLDETEKKSVIMLQNSRQMQDTRVSLRQQERFWKDAIN